MTTGAQAVNAEPGAAVAKPIVIAELGEVVKSPGKKLVVRVMEFKGHRYLDIRMANADGERWKFGNGITVGRKVFQEFTSLLSRSQETIELALNAYVPNP